MINRVGAPVSAMLTWGDQKPSPLALEIDTARKGARLSVREFAEKLGVRPVEIGNWIRGKAPDPAPEDVERMRQIIREAKETNRGKTV